MCKNIKSRLLVASSGWFCRSTSHILYVYCIHSPLTVRKYLHCSPSCIYYCLGGEPILDPVWWPSERLHSQVNWTLLGCWGIVEEQTFDGFLQQIESLFRSKFSGVPLFYPNFFILLFKKISKQIIFKFLCRKPKQITNGTT